MPLHGASSIAIKPSSFLTILLMAFLFTSSLSRKTQELCHRDAAKIQNELPQTHARKTRENVYATSVDLLSKSEVGGGGDVIAQLWRGRWRVAPVLRVDGENLLDQTRKLQTGEERGS